MSRDDFLWHVLDYTVPAALALLPGRMDSPSARAMLLTIGLQESGFTHRVQRGGPAHGFWQFEKGGGVTGVLVHPMTKPTIDPVLTLLRYPPTAVACYNALVDNDVLACIFARLLLWTLPGALPMRHDAERGWRQYLAAWRPGKPHPETWRGHFHTAWATVEGA
jgi:hypothetical protein